ncbi:MAG: NAD-glutamate dehydrogenase domain-containing protein [Myxococcota bacterium]
MPVLTYTKQMLNAAEAPELVDAEFRDLFLAFVQAVNRQIRQPYHKRFTPQQTAQHLAGVFEKFLDRDGDQVIIDATSRGRTLVLTTVMPDQPFIVDTIRMRLQAQGAVNLTGFNAVIGVHREDNGRATRVGSPGDRLESVIRMEIDGIDTSVLDEVIDDLRACLQLARSMVEDFHQMTDIVEATTFKFSRLADRVPDQGDRYRETGEFLRWLLADNFVFMSVIQGENSYGFAQPARAELWPQEEIQPWPQNPNAEVPVVVRKGRRESPVHRAGRIDEIHVEMPDTDGRGPRALVIQGLFTYRALTQPSRHVPLLRRVLGRILRADESKPGSYRYKGVANVFDSLPTEFLFTATSDQIVGIINQVLEAEQEQEVRAQILQGDDTTFVLAAMPRVRWSERLSDQIEDVLREGTGASYTDQGIFVSRYNTMLVHYYLTGTRPMTDADVDKLRDRILDLATPWEMRLYEALVESLGVDRAENLSARYGQAFEDTYRLNRPTAESVRDLEMLERLQREERTVIADVFTEYRSRLYLRIYQDRNILLSHMLPVLDNFGIVIIDQFADPVTLPDGTKLYIDTFRLEAVPGLTTEEVIARGDNLSAGIEAVFDDRIVSDPLNCLLLQINLPWQAVDMFRAYHGYARQLGLYYSIERVQTVLLSQPEMVSLLWAYFEARFDPDRGDDRAEQESAAAEAFEDALRAVKAADQDLVFRTFYNLLQSTLRTNFYRRDRKFHYLSFKFDCAKVQNMPSPRMMFEIYVHHRDMEGVHLRGGKVARGGIRWSDRTDFRREILDLVSTQMIKNVLIVPVGAKGGFRMKRRVADRAESRRMADQLYQVLIRGMLDISDNIVNGETTHPPRVVIHDAPDPYLVVAADKGTAHLSDTANRLSREYGFWLDDAFASGGSNGYDHKKVGITARGAWVTAKRHFLEMGLDPYQEEFTAVGIGDTGGDVFGNGVIETPHMRLLGAFNHLHVFLDPNPDTRAAYEERVRLFKAVKGWDQYNQDLISEGGGVFSRQAKSIPLTPQVQELLGVLKDELPPDTVIRLLLRLNVDLLWNGGIGTYVKATAEDQLDAGDPSNDNLRINGNELRTRIVAEGGNLGFTQAGRIEYAAHGGRVNTDAIDNSGGVDMSDHEVNLKILLSPVVARGDLTTEARNDLLERMTDEVADQVLHNSDVHGRQISLDMVRSASDPMAFSRTIDWVCRRSNVSRADLRLPTNDELARRGSQSRGLTRPELAVLNAHVKMHVYTDLMMAEPDEIPNFADEVTRYFPAEVQTHHLDAIKSHMLYKSIGMTVVTNEIMGETGAWFFPGLTELTSASAATITRGWIRSMDLISAGELLQEIEDSGASLDARYRAWVSVTDAVWSMLSLWLSTGEEIPGKEARGQIQRVLSLLPTTSGTEHQDRFRIRAEALPELPPQLSRRIAVLGELSVASEVIKLPGATDRLQDVLVSYLAIGEASRLLPAIRALETRRSSGGWDPVAISLIRNRYIHQMRTLVQNINLGPEAKLGVDRVTLRLSRKHLARLSVEMDDVLTDTSDIAALLVAEERLRSIIERDFLSQGGVFGTGM